MQSIREPFVEFMCKMDNSNLTVEKEEREIGIRNLCCDHAEVPRARKPHLRRISLSSTTNN
jgi:hypothetical protein